MHSMNTVMIIAGESSGELYGSLLAKELERQRPGLNIIGIGGSRMSEAGVELISRTSDAFGLMEAVSSLRRVRAAFRSAVSALKTYEPGVLVLIDYPDFNFRVGKMAKSLGIKILYYVSPQVWAWRKGRVKEIAGFVDRMAVILPFEEELYRAAGVPCEFVGHPILEEIGEVFEKAGNGRMIDGALRASFKAALGLDPDKPVLSLLPGSRPSELTRHLPLMVEVVRAVKSDPELHPRKDYQFCMPLAPNTDETKYGRFLEALRQEGVVINKGESVRTVASSDVAVVASGTATLQTALLEVPMIVIYKLSALSYHLGKRILDVKHISLANILSGSEVVKELIQDRANPREILEELKRIAFDPQYRDNMILHYKKMKEPFLGKSTSKRVAGMVMELAGIPHFSKGG
jgi:lipid-A-disaccharide synthase